MPVESYAGESVQPTATDAHGDVAALVEEYERATAAEQAAWSAVRDLATRAAESARWNAWRDAMERTQRAARALVNFGAAR